MIEYKQMEEEMAELCTFDFVEPPTGEAVPTLNASPSTQQGSPLQHMPVKNVDLDEMKKPGGMINATTMGAALILMGDVMSSRIAKADSPTRDTQHILIPPAILASCPLTNSQEDKLKRDLICNRLRIPSTKNETQESFDASEMRLRLVTPFRDRWSNNDSNTFQWAALIVDLGKKCGEKYLKWKAHYCLTGHDRLDAQVKCDINTTVETFISKVKRLVKSNLSGNDVKCTWKTYPLKNHPTPFTLMPEADPNDTALSVLLWIGTVATRILFFAEHNSMEKVVRRSVSSFEVEEQRALMHDALEKEIVLLPQKDVRRRLGWIPGDATSASSTPHKESQQSPGFNANQKDIENNALAH